MNYGEIPVLTKAFDSHILIEVRDEKGNLVYKREDKNRETIWAKLNTPVSNLTMAFVFDKLSKIFGRDFDDINLTLFDQVDKIRWPWYSVGFSRSGNVYTALFNWTNEGNVPVNIYAFISYSGDNLYTVYNMENYPIKVNPNYVISGKYIITYDKSTPSVPSDGSFSVSTINKNGLVYGTTTEIGKSLREYKYTRIFPKTSEYTGVHTDDTGVTSQLDITITSSDTMLRAFGNVTCGELFYKCLLSGSPGGAKAVRYINYQCTGTQTNYVMGNFPYRVIGKDSICGGCSCRIYGYVDAVSDVDNPSNPYGKEIYPWEMHFPTTIERIQELSLPRFDSGDLSITTYLSVNPRVVYEEGSISGVFQQVMYLYWNDNPTFNIWLYSLKSLNGKVFLYINGVKYEPVITKIKDAETDLYKCSFDLSGLSAGEGIVIFTISNDRDICVRWCSDYYRFYRVDMTAIVVESDMWGYAIPFIGFLRSDSSDISSGWISSGIVSYQGTNVDLSFIVNETNASSIGLVNNMPLHDAFKYTDYLYWVWVTEDQANKLAGEFCPYSKTKLQAMFLWGHEDDRHYSLVTTPVYLKNNYIALKYQTCKGKTNQTLIDFSSLVPLWDDMLTIPETAHHKVDLSSRKIEFKTDRPFDLLLEFGNYGRTLAYNSKWKSYIIRKQGTTSYDYRIPKALTSYTEGQATIQHGNDIYEYETVLEANETIGNLTVNINTSSVFAQDEYFSFPISDGRGFLLVDSLETWKRFSGENFPITDLTPMGEENSGTDIIISTDDTQKRVVTGNFYKTRDAVVDIIDNSIKLHPDHNYYFVVNMKYIPYVNDALYLIHVPKWIDDNGVRRYVNVESIMVTDGHHIIPWNLYQHGNRAIESCLRDNVLNDNWIIRLDDTILKDIYALDNRATEVILHVYFAAKTKEEILPLDLEVYISGLESLPHFYNDNFCWCLIRPGTSEGDFVNVINDAKHIRKPSLTSSSVSLGDISGALKFTSSYPSYINVPLDSNICRGFKSNLPEDKATISTYFKIDELPSEWGVLFGCKYVWIVVNNEGWLYIGWANGDVGHPNRFARIGYVGDLDWHHIAVVKRQYFYSIYLDGVRKRMINPSVDTDDEFALSTGRFFSDGTFRIGIASDNSYPLSFQIREFFMSLTACWDPQAEFIYYPNIEGSWDDPNTWQPPQDLSKDVVVRFELPYALDEAIDVKDEDGNTPLYCVLDDQGHKVNGEKSKGNVVYIRLTLTPKFDETMRKRSFLDVGYYLGPQASFCGEDLYMYVSYYPQWLDTTAVDVGVLRYNLHCNSVSSTTGLVVCDKPLFDYRWEVTGNLIQRIMLPRTERHVFKLQASQMPTMADPDDIFDVYILPTNVSERAISVFNLKEDIQISPTLFRVFEDDDANKIVITPEDVVNTVEAVVGSNIHLEGRNRDVYWEDHLLFTVDAFPRYMFPYYSLFFRDSLILKRQLRFVYILMYESPIGATWNYRVLRCNTGADTHQLFVKDATYANIWGDYITDVTPISGEKELLLITPHDASRDIPAWELEPKEGNLKIYTYYVDNFDSIFPFYKNDVGNHVLSNPSKGGLLYHFYHSRFNPNCKYGKLYYIYTKNSEVASLLSLRIAELPMTKIGFISNTDADIVEAGTGYSSSPTDTVVIRRYSATNLFMFPNAVAGGNSIGFTYRYPSRMMYDSNNLIDILSPNRLYDDIRISSYVTWNDDIRSAPTITHAHSPYTQPMLHHSDIQLWDIHSLLWQTFNTRKIFIREPYLVRETAQKLPMIIMNEGSLDDDAVWVDFRVIPNINMYYNIIWDVNKIPVNSVISFGTWSFIGADSININNSSSRRIFPLLRFENQNTGEVKWFGLEKEQLVPVDVTNVVNSISDVTNEFDTYALYQLIESYRLTENNSFVPFDSLIDDFNSGEWFVSYAWLIYVSDFDINASAWIIKSFSVQPSLSDTNLYKVVDYCYKNTKYDILTNDCTEIIPSSYEIKIYNRSGEMLTNVVLRINLEEVPVNNYTNGIVAYMDGLPIPTIYEIDEKGKLGDNFSAFQSLNKKFIHVKIPSIDAYEIKTIVLQDEENLYTPDAVYDYYYEFNVLDANQWKVTRLPFSYEGVVNDVDGGTGATSITDRLVSLYYDDVYIEDGSLVMKGSTVAVSSLQQFQSGGLLEIGYETDAYTDPVVWYSDDDIQIDLVELPTYHVEHHNITYVRVEDLKYGQLYYEEGAERASDVTVFETYKLPEGTSGWFFDSCNCDECYVRMPGMTKFSTYPDLAYIWCINSRGRTSGFKRIAYYRDESDVEGCVTVLRKEATVHWYLRNVDYVYTDAEADAFVGLSRRLGVLYCPNYYLNTYFYAFTLPFPHKLSFNQNNNIMEYFAHVPLSHEGVIPIKGEYTTPNRKFYAPVEPQSILSNGLYMKLNPSIYDITVSNPTQIIAKNEVIEDYYCTVMRRDQGSLMHGGYLPQYGFTTEVSAGWNEFYVYYDSQDAPNVKFLNDISPTEAISYENVYEQLGRYVFVDMITRVVMNTSYWRTVDPHRKVMFTSHFIPCGFLAADTENNEWNLLGYTSNYRHRSGICIRFFYQNYKESYRFDRGDSVFRYSYVGRSLYEILNSYADCHYCGLGDYRSRCGISFHFKYNAYCKREKFSFGFLSYGRPCYDYNYINYMGDWYFCGVNLDEWMNRGYTIVNYIPYPINYTSEVGDEEIGSWNIGGYTFNKRRKLRYYAPYKAKSAVLYFEYYLVGDSINFRVVREATSGGATLPAFNTAKPTVMQVGLESGNVTIKAYPVQDYDKWIFKEKEERAEAVVPDSGKIHFVVKSAENNKTKIHWIRYAGQKNSTKVVQLMKKDAKLLVKNEPTCWYLIDSTAAQQPSFTNIEAHINNVYSRNKSAIVFFKHLPFPYAGLILKGPLALGYSVFYRA